MSQNRLPLKLNCECKAQRGSIESLYIALGMVVLWCAMLPDKSGKVLSPNKENSFSGDWSTVALMIHIHFSFSDLKLILAFTIGLANKDLRLFKLCPYDLRKKALDHYLPSLLHNPSTHRIGVAVSNLEGKRFKLYMRDFYP